MDSRYVVGVNWPPSISGSVDLHHRMNYMRSRGLGFSFVNIKDPDLNCLMERIDPELPHIMAVALSDFYRNGTSKLTDLLENEKNDSVFEPVGKLLSHLSEDSNPDDDQDELLESAVLKATMADRFGCASLFRVGHKYHTLLILQIECR